MLSFLSSRRPFPSANDASQNELESRRVRVTHVGRTILDLLRMASAMDAHSSASAHAPAAGEVWVALIVKPHQQCTRELGRPRADDGNDVIYRAREGRLKVEFRALIVQEDNRRRWRWHGWTQAPEVQLVAVD